MNDVIEATTKTYPMDQPCLVRGELYCIQADALDMRTTLRPETLQMVAFEPLMSSHLSLMESEKGQGKG
jgi:hypothetical protein